MNIERQEITVTIVMAAYNGSAFVREQIDSIQSQSHSNWKLVVRDDDSSDTTMRVLEEMANNDSRIEIVRDNKGNLRQCQNFNELLSIVKADEYVMCCDQDDIWLPEKIETTLREMRRAERFSPPGTPLLVFTDFQVVDRHLRILSYHSAVIRRIRRLERFDVLSLLGYNYVWGCSTMLNHKLLEAALPISADAESHDYWIALAAAALGKIIFVDEVTMLYRRHDSAVTGGPHIGGWRARIQRHILSRADHETKVANLDMQMISFNQFLKSKEKADPLMETFVEALQSGRWGRLTKVIKMRVRKQGIPQQLIYYIDTLIICGRQPVAGTVRS